MVIVDTALKKRYEEGNPVRVGMVGAGYMGRGVALQISSGMEGIELVAIANRTVENAEQAYSEAGVDTPTVVQSVSQLEAAVEARQPAIMDDPSLVCQAESIDAVLEATGEIEFGAKVALEAIEHRKHLVLLNAELDATVGPILKHYADKAGVVLSNADGDEPGVAMNLYRFVDSIGYQPVMAGNIKGFYDPYRTPETQRGFAEKHNQDPKMITSFADGTKLSMETTVLANATGFGVAKRGMHGHECGHVNDLLDHFSAEDVQDQGLIEYVLGAAPGTGAFVVGYNEHPVKQQYMQYFKMGDGPLYLFYTPFHLPHMQVPLTLARAVLFQDAAVAPQGAPSCDVLTVAKRDLQAGETLDGIGGFMSYGLIENAEVSIDRGLLPMGLSEGCSLKSDVKQDQPITYEDVEIPEGRLVDELRAEQNERYFSKRVLA